MPWENPRSLIGGEVYSPAEREAIGKPEPTINSDPNRRLVLVFNADAKAHGELNGAANLTDSEKNEALQRAFDAMVAEVAIYDVGGSLVVSNEAWRSNAGSNDGAKLRRPANSRSDHRPLQRDGDNKRIQDAVGRVLSGEKEGATLTFSVGNGVERSRFRVRATGLGDGATRKVMIVKTDVTEIYSLHRENELLARQLVQSRERERRRIAREMHDSTVQDLVAIGLILKRIHTMVNEPAAQELLAEVRGILGRTKQDLRTLSYLLHPPLLEEGGLAVALKSLINGLSARMNTRIRFECDEHFSRPQTEIESALYRVAQEALINVHKHASAEHAVVRYYRQRGHLHLQVEDDGVGIGGRRGYHAGAGVGIEGMRARLAQLGGTLTLSSSGAGTKLDAAAPLRDA